MFPGARAQPTGAKKPGGRVAWVAAFNGWSVAILGGLFLVISIVWFSLAGILVCAAATASGCMELTGRRRLKAGRPVARRWLAGSQLLLLGAILLYAGYQMSAITPQSLADALKEAGGLSLDPGLLEWYVGIARACYAAVMLASLLYQGGLCLYYTLATRYLYLEPPPEN